MNFARFYGKSNKLVLIIGLLVVFYGSERQRAFSMPICIFLPLSFFQPSREAR
jgi:hypothetical protein